MNCFAIEITAIELIYLSVAVSGWKGPVGSAMLANMLLRELASITGSPQLGVGLC